MFLTRNSFSTFLTFSSFLLSEYAFSVNATQPIEDGLHWATIVEDAIENQWIIKFNESGSSMTKNELKELATAYNAKVERVYKYAFNGASVEMRPEDAKKLVNDPRVAYVEQDSIVKMNQVPTWGLDRVDQREQVLDNTPYNPRNNGGGVTVYVISSGIHITHNEFQGRAIWGANFVEDGIDDDCNGHGTHVAGTIAGDVYGVGNAISVVALKVFPCRGSSPYSTIIAAVDWVLIDARNKDKTVCNMSLGGGYSQAMNDATASMVDSGVITVVAAGNDNRDACGYSPASEPKAITVGSTREGDSRSSFSNYGTCVDIFAPGSAITSAWCTSDIELNVISGTSMASPHVAGGVALLLNANIPDAGAVIIEAASKVDISNEGRGSPELMLYVGDMEQIFVPSSAPTECRGDFFNVDVLTDQYPDETSWILTDTCAGGITIFERPDGYFDVPNHLYEDIFCSAESSRYEFTISDTYGDGICCSFGNGSYSVVKNGDLVASGGDFGSQDSTSFGSCAEPSPGPSAAPTISDVRRCEDSPIQMLGPQTCKEAESSGGCEKPEVQSHCPATCKACDTYECADSMARFFYLDQEFDCNTLAEFDSDTITYLCDENSDLSATCRTTCAICAN